MPKRALVEHRPWLLASILASLAFYAVTRGWWPGPPIADLYLAVLKGAGVGFLAVYAWVRHPERDAKVVALFMLLGALGDSLLDLFFQVGAGFFLAGHLVAVAFYLQHRRPVRSPTQLAAAGALLVGTPLISWLLTQDPLVLLYSAGLAAMAATAWISRFPRYRVGLGAVLFVISDLLIFARIGLPGMKPAADLLVWPIYYCGQFLIATGIIQTLRSERASS